MTVPSSARSSNPKMRRRVVLPAPFVPRMTVMLPEETLRSIRRRTSRAPKHLRTPRTVTRSVEMADIAGLRRALAQAGQESVDQEGDQEQDDTQRDGAVEAALTGLEDERRGQRAGCSLDVAAHQHGCPDLANGVAKRRDDGTEDSQACLAEQGDGRPVSYTHLRAHETRHDLVCR